MHNILSFSQSTFCSWGVDSNWFCPVYEKSLGKKDNMQRHVISNFPFQTVAMPSNKCQRFRFEHPFTCMIAGMTGSLKTTWVRFLLQQASEQDSYFDVNKRNLIVFDDQMIDASKDKRIMNLFNLGSYHRNLSVIYIVQNLFHQGTGSRSISLNSH